MTTKTIPTVDRQPNYRVNSLPNEVPVKFTQANIFYLALLGRDSLFNGESYMDQLILKEYFTGDIFKQMSAFSSVGDRATVNVRFKISTLLVLVNWLEKKQFASFILSEFRAVIARRKIPAYVVSGEASQPADSAHQEGKAALTTDDPILVVVDS